MPRIAILMTILIFMNTVHGFLPIIDDFYEGLMARINSEIHIEHMMYMGFVSDDVDPFDAARGGRPVCNQRQLRYTERGGDNKRLSSINNAINIPCYAIGHVMGF